MAQPVGYDEGDLYDDGDDSREGDNYANSDEVTALLQDLAFEPSPR